MKFLLFLAFLAVMFAMKADAGMIIGYGGGGPPATCAFPLFRNGTPPYQINGTPPYQTAC